MITWDDFDKIWASTSPLTPYSFSDPNYAQGWNFIGSTPPARQMWDSIQKQNDEKFKYLRDNFGTPNIVTQASQMTDTDKVYVYLGSEAGWNSGHWYYYDEGTSSWADGGVYNSVAFVTDTTLSIAGQPADAKATGDALALKSDLAGCTFTGNVSVNADLSVTGDATIGTDLSVTGSSTLTNLSVSGTTALAGTSTAPTPSADDNSTKIATTEYVQTEIKPIEVNADIVNKRVTNIEKLLQGNLYDYQTDTDSKYTKTVPAGAMPYASLDSIGGKTLVWNQLVDTGTTTVNTISGHKYYTLIDGTASIVTSDGTAISVVDDTADMVCDLTLMFGSGNEPTTVAEFTAQFPAQYYPYNAGTLLSAGVTSVDSVGINVIDDGGSASWSGTETKTFSGVFLAGVTYTITTFDDSNTSYSFTILNPNNETILGWTQWQTAHNSGVQFTPYQTTNTIKIRSNNPAGIVTSRRLMVVMGSTKPTTFVPYKAPITYPIPAEIRSLDGYGWSAGSVYNYIDYERKVFVKRVGRVDLGSFTYSVSADYFGAPAFYTGTFPQYKASGTSLIGNFVNERYVATSIQSLQQNPNTPSMALYTNGSINIRDSNYSASQVADLKTSLNGVYLYYELATPQETDISAYITDDNLIEVEAGGSLTFPNSNGDDYRINVPSSETYMVDLQASLGG